MTASLKKEFANYYDSLMPIMQKIINSVGIVEIKTLAIECMGFLLLSIANEKREQFMKDSEMLMNLFIKH